MRNFESYSQPSTLVLCLQLFVIYKGQTCKPWLRSTSLSFKREDNPPTLDNPSTSIPLHTQTNQFKFNKTFNNEKLKMGPDKMENHCTQNNIIF